MGTIHDVAKKAGVSAATASRVFSGRVTVSEPRTQAVLQAAKELGFIPNSNARRLRTSSSEIIAMMVPDIQNSFFTYMARGVEDVAQAAGYSVMLCNTDEDPQRESDYLRVAVGDPVAGIIVAPSGGINLQPALDRNIPVVCVDRHASGYDVDAVVPDNFDPAAAATRLLFDAGYQRLACISGPENIETADQRLAGWAQAVREHTGCDPDPQYIRRVPYFGEEGSIATSELLSLPNPPDAIFCANNRLAANTLWVLHKRNLLPPKVGVVSFGGFPPISLAPSGVIVTLLPARDIGMYATQMLIERINGDTGPTRSVVLPITIETKDSAVSLL